MNIRDGIAVTPGRERPSYDRETVLRLAIGLFSRQGYDATSMEDLSRELGLAKSAIYHHIPSKEYLLEKAFDEALDNLAAVFDRAEAKRTASAYDRLRGAIEDGVDVLVAHLPSVTLLLRARGNSAVEQHALRRRRRLDDRLVVLVRAAAAEGALRDDIDPRLISQLLFGTVNSLADWLRPNGTYDAPELAAAVASVVFDGLRTPGPGRSRSGREHG